MQAIRSAWRKILDHAPVVVSYPSFIVQPTSQTANDGETVIYTAQATNGATLQWFFDGALAVGETGESFSVLALAADNGAQVYCIATKDGETVQSDTARLTVISNIYNFNGTSNYLQLDNEIVVPAASDFDITFESEFKSNSFYVGSNYPLSTTRIMFLSNGAFYVNGTQVFKLTTPMWEFMRNTDSHKLKISRVGLVWTVSINDGQYTQSGSVASTSELRLTSLFRAWGTAPSTLWLKGRASKIRINVNGSSVLSTDINKKPLGANQVGASIVDYNESSWFAIPDPLARNYDNIVFVGASIVEQTFGKDLVNNNLAATSYFNEYGVKVYGYGWSGYTLDNGCDKLAEAIAHFAGTRTLFVPHLGGNDTSGTRPYATMNASGVQQITLGFNKLYTTINSVLNDTVVADLSFRDYDDTTHANQENGSLPYVLNEQSPRRLAKFTNTDGRSVMDWYNFTYQNYLTFLSADNIHPTEEGKVMLREFSLDRLKYIVMGGDMPPPL